MMEASILDQQQNKKIKVFSREQTKEHLSYVCFQMVQLLMRRMISKYFDHVSNVNIYLTLGGPGGSMS